jgi:hypothetical protein
MHGGLGMRRMKKRGSGEKGVRQSKNIEIEIK